MPGVLCGERLSASELNRHGECTECVDAARERDSMETIRIQGRTYQVEQSDEGVHEMNRPGYLLTGPRGARYRTLRNSRNPHMLYLFNARAGPWPHPRSG